jgi:uncharacterized protein (TIGR02594 family)
MDNTTRPLLFTWHEIARKEVGVKEFVGIADNPRVVEYHSTTTLRATDDEVPWCSSFVNWVMAKAGYPITKSAAARSWLKYGKQISEPVPGCIVVMNRNGGGHVGFYESTQYGNVRILGGNQDDAVNVKPFRPNRIIAYVLPAELNEKDQTTYDQMRG